jgi:hypothetical protein
MIQLVDSNTIHITYNGDGVSTSFTFDLAKAPFNMNFNGNLPTGINWANFSGYTVTGSVNGTVITLNFSSAPPVNGYDGMIQLAY